MLVDKYCNSIKIKLAFSSFKARNSNIFKHLKGSVVCKEACNDSCFKVLDSANTSFKLKIKEALHIQWERPDLNKQIQHYNFSLSF